MRRLVASSLGLGLIPGSLRGSDAGAGTMGALPAAAAAVAMAAVSTPWWVMMAIAAALILVSLWAAAPFAVGGEDPGWVSIDETAGTMVAAIGLAGWPLAAALVVARLADILKVLPGVRQAERLPGAVGITADDVLAGIYGLGIGWLLTALL